MAGNRIRSVRPELLEHPRFAALSDGAVRLWMGLLSCWDDEGRSLGSVGYVAGRVYFARAKTRTMIGRELAELESSGWLIRYQVAGVDYLAVRGWSDPESETFQYIKAPRPSKLPTPPSIPWPKPDAKDGAKPDAKPWSLDLDQDQDQEQEREPARAIPPCPEQTPEQTPQPTAPAPDVPSASPQSATPAARTPGEPTLDQLWAELEAARQRAAAHHRVTLPPLLAHDSGRHDLSEALAAAAMQGCRAQLAAACLHAIAAAEAEAIADRRRLQWLSGAVFSPNNLRRLTSGPAPKRAGPQPATTRPREKPKEPELNTTDEQAANAAIAALWLQTGQPVPDDTPDRRRKAS